MHVHPSPLKHSFSSLSATFSAAPSSFLFLCPSASSLPLMGLMNALRRFLSSSSTATPPRRRTIRTSKSRRRLHSAAIASFRSRVMELADRAALTIVAYDDGRVDIYRLNNVAEELRKAVEAFCAAAGTTDVGKEVEDVLNEVERRIRDRRKVIKREKMHPKVPEYGRRKEPWEGSQVSDETFATALNTNAVAHTENRKQSSDGTSESGDEGAMQLVTSRTETSLRDRAENARSMRDEWRNGTEEQPILGKQRNNLSFASSLYRPQNARVGSITDAGLYLRRSNVRGDGRCLFRALVRCWSMQRGNAIMNERVERERADDLRQRAVSELRKQRELLDRFFVIEGDFEVYCRKMSSTRTYGGEPELLMLAKILTVPIAVYILRREAYRQIQVYGKQYRGQPLRILYSDGVHYDALLVANR